MLGQQAQHGVGNVAARGHRWRSVNVGFKNVGQLRNQSSGDDVADFQQQRLLQLIQHQTFIGLHAQAHAGEPLNVLAREEHQGRAIEIAPNVGLNRHMSFLILTHLAQNIVAHQQVDVRHFQQYPFLGNDGERIGGAGQANVQNLANYITL